MKANPFYLFKDIQGKKYSKDWHRGNGKYCVPGVYFWGFTLREDCGLPQNKNELVMYYIGKSTTNISERIMQEFTQLLFGGFGTIIDPNWLVKNPTKARLKNQQHDKSKNILYSPDGLHELDNFFSSSVISETLSWMKKKLIFTWVDCEITEVAKLEKEMHHIVRTNVLGGGHMVNLLPKKEIPVHTPLFNKLDWKLNIIFKNWLIEVNKHIP